MASLNYRTIDPPAPRCVPLDIQECYWWTDEDDQVWIAMRCERTPLLVPELGLVFQVSLALEKLPAGKARNYTVSRREMRARLRIGPMESRFVSQAGIVALYRKPRDVLRGSLRLQAVRTTMRLLGGWGKPTRYLILGSFVAVHDEQRGRAIADATESSGWGRGSSTRSRGDARSPRSATAPTTVPADRLEPAKARPDPRE